MDNLGRFEPNSDDGFHYDINTFSREDLEEMGAVGISGGFLKVDIFQGRAIYQPIGRSRSSEDKNRLYVLRKII